MASGKKNKAPGPQPSDDELLQLMLGAVRAAVVAKPADLKKAPGVPKAQAPHALDLLREAARTGAIFRWQKGTTEYFFASAPAALLDRQVPELLGQGPKTSAEIEAATRVPKAFIEEWKKSALAARRFHEVGKGKDRRLSLEPDLALALGKVLGKSVRAAISSLRGAGIADARIAAALLQELRLIAPGLTAPGTDAAPSQPGEGDLGLVLNALHRLASERRAGALLPVGDLRGRVRLQKVPFDHAVLALRDRGSLVLQLHDHADSLPREEQDQLVKDARGNHYVGIALPPR